MHKSKFDKVSFKITEPYCADKVEKKHISELEVLLKTKLPDSYKQFLLKENGGYPEYETFLSINGQYKMVGIEGFTGIEVNEEGINLENFRIEDPLIDEKFISIGWDGCGSYLCMSIQAETLGKIYFLDHDTDDNTWDIENIDKNKTEIAWCAFYLVQESFEGLINSNVINPEDIEF